MNPLKNHPTPAVEVTDLTKNYGSVEALKSINLKVSPGEYFVVLGPSGGGKTTLLRLIGGFIKPTRGNLFLHGTDVSELSPDKRPTSMVFQSYALFPHMTVYQNVSYGLRLINSSKSDIETRVKAMLDMVGLTGMDDRQPHELSGGQQQRVQLARSLVLERDILLLDEPLAALDAKLRKDMCFELKYLQERVGITFIHVTHNQEEAMTVADRIAIIANGQLVDADTAKNIYEHPKNRFTAEFIGENNIFEGVVESASDNTVCVNLGIGTISAKHRNLKVDKGNRVSISIRSELLEFIPNNDLNISKYESLSGTYLAVVFLGLITTHVISLENGSEVNIRMLSSSKTDFEKGQTIHFRWRREDAILHLT